MVALTGNDYTDQANHAGPSLLDERIRAQHSSTMERYGPKVNTTDGSERAGPGDGDEAVASIF